MEEDKRLTQIRLPLQIGTSALWSLARASAIFPGVVTIALGGWLAWVWRDDGDGEKVILGLCLGIAFGGALLVYYGWTHLKLVMAERPSDVVLDTNGVRIEGGRRDGVALAWADIDPATCRIAYQTEERLVLWRVIVNIPIFAAALAGGEVNTIVEPSAKIPVERLLVGDVLLAEAELEIERRSLATLARTMKSSRWYGGAHKQQQKQKKQKKQKERSEAIICPKCGATVAPSSEASVACRFCSEPVPIPDDVRKRVEAAAKLAVARRSGMARLERLLVSQPSAGFARATMWIAAVPILIAWPLTAALIFRNATLGLLVPERLLPLAALPLLLTIGAFLLARGRLTDRFALHAVVVGFGARDPERPGEPYRCRACEAALPAATTTPVVRCVFCNQANVLGLDLRGDAHEAAEEHAQLESAMARRTRERWLWRGGSIASLGLLAGAFFVVRGTMHDLPRPDFDPVSLTGTVVKQSVPNPNAHGVPPIGPLVKWTLDITPSTARGVNCHVALRATDSGHDPFVYSHDGRCKFASGVPSKFRDGRSDDNDPKVDIDLAKKTVVVSESFEDDNSDDWRIEVRLR